MEHIWEVARRLIEPLLDDLVEVVVEMPEGEHKADLNRFIHELDEQLTKEVER